jgi:hypothetical protein
MDIQKRSSLDRSSANGIGRQNVKRHLVEFQAIEAPLRFYTAETQSGR